MANEKKQLTAEEIAEKEQEQRAKTFNGIRYFFRRQSYMVF